MEIRDIVKTIMNESTSEDYSESEAVINEIYRKIVLAAESIKSTLTSKVRFRRPDDAIRAMDELNTLVDSDIEDLVNAIEQRLD